MLISGCTFIRNGFSLGYPVKESLASLMELCDEVIVVVGNSDDGTLEYVKSLQNPNIHIIETVWDETLRAGGKILAQQTNIGLRACKGDWIVYLQADEVLHEEDIPRIKKSMEEQISNVACEGFLFKYIHFFGNYESIGVGRQWYRNEIRVVRNSKNVESWKDAQGFRINAGNNSYRKLNVIPIDAHIYHYGWVRNPSQHRLKQNAFQRLYHDDSWLQEHLPKSDEFPSCYELTHFTGKHPAKMIAKIHADAAWTKQFNPNISTPRPFRVLVCDIVERYTGYRIGEYKNYNILSASNHE